MVSLWREGRICSELESIQSDRKTNYILLKKDVFYNLIDLPMYTEKKIKIATLMSLISSFCF